MGEDLFKYGQYTINKNSLITNINSNLDKYIEHQQYDNETANKFKYTVNLLSEGIKNGTITPVGEKRYKDNSGKLTYNADAFDYVDLIAKSVYAYEQKAQEQNNPEIIEDEDKNDVQEKTPFDIKKHGFLKYYLDSVAPNRDANTNINQVLAEHSNATYGTAGPTPQYNAYVKNLHDLLKTYQQKFNGFAEYTMPSDMLAYNISDYNKDVSDLIAGLSDGDIGENEIALMHKLNLDELSDLVPKERKQPIVEEVIQTPSPVTADDLNKASEEADWYWLNGKPFEWDSKEMLNLFGPIALDLGTIVNPEPISGTIMGLGSDFWNWYQNRFKPGGRDFSWDSSHWTADDAKRHSTNVMFTMAGMLPYAGDIGNVSKLLHKLESARPMLMKIGKGLATGGLTVGGVALSGLILPEVYNLGMESYENISSGKATAEDYRNLSNLVLSILAAAKGVKGAYDVHQSMKHSVIEGAEVPIKSNNSKDKQFVLDGTEYDDLAEAMNGKGRKPSFEKKFKDKFGETPTTTELPEKTYVYDPDLARANASQKGKQTQQVVDYKTRNKVTSTKASPISTAYGSNVLTASMKGKKLNAAAQKEILDAFNKIPAKVGFNKFKNAFPWTYSDEWKKFVEVATKHGFSRSELDNLRKTLKLYKEGGVLKANLGIKLPENFTQNLLENGGDAYFTYDEDTKQYKLKSDIDQNAFNEWLNNNNLSFDEPKANYGTGYTYKPYDRTTVYDENAQSIGWHGKDYTNRSENLTEIEGLDRTKPLNLNQHVRQMYQTNTGTQDRVNDFIGWYSSQSGISSIDDLLRAYNSEIDNAYSYKSSENGRTYGDSDETETFNTQHRRRHGSQNAIGGLYGYDEASQRVNGATTMSRGIDITDDDVLLDVSENEALSKLLNGKQLYKSKDGRLYVKDSTGTISKIVSGDEETGDKESGNTEETPVMLAKKKNIPDYEMLLSTLDYYNHLKHNKKQLELNDKLQPLIYDPLEDSTIVHGNLRALINGKKKAANLTNAASKSLTSDANLYQAQMLEAAIRGQEFISEGEQADDLMYRETSEKAREQEMKNHQNRHETAMKNRENMKAVKDQKLLAKMNKERADLESDTNYNNKWIGYLKTNRERDQKYRDYYYNRALLTDIQNNPNGYLKELKQTPLTKDELAIWYKGLNSASQLTSDELQIYNQIKSRLSGIHTQFLAEEYGVEIPNSPVERYRQWTKRTDNFSPIIVKRGGKINKEMARTIISYLKESNKNYNKAIDRSVKGLYNHIKLQRKK